MQAIFEPIFSFTYLIIVITLGFILYKSNWSKYTRLFGLMALILGFGDSFHLIPRIYALLTVGIDAPSMAPYLGVGKLITSITMTIFYLILYTLWKIRFNKIETKKLDLLIYFLVISRVILCLFPQNDWLSVEPSYMFGIIRNIPFVLFGVIMIKLIYNDAKKQNDLQYIKIAIGVLLSFIFYIPVFMFAREYTIIGLLMIPKTVAYAYIVYTGYSEFKYAFTVHKNLIVSQTIV